MFWRTHSGNVNAFKAGSAPNIQVADFVGRISNILKINGGFAAGRAFDCLTPIELST